MYSRNLHQQVERLRIARRNTSQQFGSTGQSGGYGDSESCVLTFLKELPTMLRRL